MYVRIKIEKKTDGTAFGENDSALSVDQIFHTMWSSVDVSLNQVQVSTSGTNYMYKAAIENILNYSKSTKELQLSLIGMTTDTTNFNSTKPGEGNAALGINSELATHKQLFGTDGHGSCEFTGPLLTDISNKGCLILDNVDIDINLWPSKDDFRLLVDPNTLNCKLTIEDII